jgi:Rrf2 family protein
MLLKAIAMLTRTGVHAILALVALGKLPRGSYAGAAGIAAGIGAPRNYLGKLLQTLAERGLLESQKGKGGGFRLACKPAAISVFDVLAPIEHLSRWEGCFLGRRRCSDKGPCPVHCRWAAVRNVYLEFLKQTTIADLLRQPQLPASSAPG